MQDLTIFPPGGKGGVAPFILTFISTFGTLGVKVALLKLMSLRTLGEETIKRLESQERQKIFKNIARGTTDPGY